MSRIFLSHSSKNNTEAIVLKDWLAQEGWDDVFLDLDPERGILAGERWERALNEAANRCEAVLFLVSQDWLASDWCLKEFRLAEKLNKRMFGIVISKTQTDDLPVDLRKTWQLVDLYQGRDHQLFQAVLPDGQEQHITFSKSGLKRLRNGLAKTGLDPNFFAWPPEHDKDRPPYRGLKPLEAEDAGIFFGREAPTLTLLDKLRGLKGAPPPRILVILGASGAGKSSFLRAGLLPRLERDDRNFLPLPLIRPERAAITGDLGLLASLEAIHKHKNIKFTRAEIRESITGGVEGVGTLIDKLAHNANCPEQDGEKETDPPSVVIVIDQAEELFLSEGREEAKQLLSLIVGLALRKTPKVIVLFTIRSDAYEHLQTASEFDGLRLEVFNLAPLPRGAYQTVIEGPAQRLKDTSRPLTIDPKLTEQLLADIEVGGAKDALPLLAFTLERLYLEHGGDGDLKLLEYQSIGGISGSIEVAVEQALKFAEQDPSVPRDRATRLTLLHKAFIPWLAGIDHVAGLPRRRVARLSEIPDDARPLVQCLIEQRLLTTDVSPETGESTVEPAHESLLRQWGMLRGWLEEDFTVLSNLEGIKRAARDWIANARDPAWLSHTRGRLEDAEHLENRDDLSSYLDASDRSYLDDCRSAETARTEKGVVAEFGKNSTLRFWLLVPKRPRTVPI